MPHDPTRIALLEAAAKYAAEIIAREGYTSAEECEAFGMPPGPGNHLASILAALAAWNRRPVLHDAAEGMVGVLERTMPFLLPAERALPERNSQTSAVRAEIRALLSRIRGAGI